MYIHHKLLATCVLQTYERFLIKIVYEIKSCIFSLVFYVPISILLRIIITCERSSFSGYVADALANCVSRSRKLQSIKLQNYTS